MLRVVLRSASASFRAQLPSHASGLHYCFRHVPRSCCSGRLHYRFRVVPVGLTQKIRAKMSAVLGFGGGEASETSNNKLGQSFGAADASYNLATIAD